MKLFQIFSYYVCHFPFFIFIFYEPFFPTHLIEFFIGINSPNSGFFFYGRFCTSTLIDIFISQGNKRHQWLAAKLFL